MKIALILTGNLYFAPYLDIYTDVLKEEKIEYDLINWDREGSELPGIYKFSRKSSLTAPKYKKLYDYCLYQKFICSCLKKKPYDRVIVFGPQIGILNYTFLKKHYNKKIIFDYRDLSIEQKFKKLFKKFLSTTISRYVSSPAYIKCLPQGFNYFVSHNVRIDSLIEGLTSTQDSTPPLPDKIEVLTIGGIRNYEQNRDIIKALANDERFFIRFVGKGPATESLINYAKETGVENIEFTGYYKKEDELKYIKQASIINIYYPQVLSHETILSNRFYAAIIASKPIITTKNSIQGDYTDKYNIGISLNNTDNLADKLVKYIEQFDTAIYQKNRTVLLKQFIEDYKIFKETLLTSLKN